MTFLHAQRELLWDLEHITDMTGGARLALHQPRFCEVALVHDAPWEGNVCCYHTVIQDGSRYCLYYRGEAWDFQKNGAEHPTTTCYAESDDGIHWRKPNLGIFEFNGSRDNNIIWMGDESTHNFSPFLDRNPDCLPGQRFKAIGGTLPKGLFLYASPDGIHWTKVQEEPIIQDGAFDSQNTAFYDTALHCYVAHFREMQPVKGHFSIRAIRRATSPDCIHWSKPAWLEYGPDAPPMEHYTNAIQPYFRCPGIYIGFPKRFMRDRTTVYDHSGGGGIPGLSDGLFMSSRDGIHYHRWSEAFVRPGIQHDRWINRNNMTATGYAVTRSDIPEAPDELSIYSTEAYYTEHPNRLRRLSVRMDGFVSVQAPYNGGAFTMKPTTFAPTTMPPQLQLDSPVRIVTRPRGDRALQVATPSVYTLPVKKNLGRQASFAITIDNTRPGAVRRLFSSYAGGRNNAGARKFLLDMQVGQANGEWPLLRYWYDGVEIGLKAEDCPDWPSQSRGRLAIVATYDDGLMNLYVNGKRVASGGQAGHGDLETSIGAVRFGEDYPPASTTNEPYLGEVLEMAVVERAFDEQEVAQAARQGLAGILAPQERGVYYDMSNEHPWELVNKLDAAQQPLSLYPLRWGDTMLMLNASTSAAGEIRCELRDETGKPFPGYALADCQPLYGDELELVVSWKNGPDITPLANRPVILHFELRDADIYSFHFGQPEDRR